jgi:PAS domain S-box-containing protein
MGRAPPTADSFWVSGLRTRLAEDAERRPDIMRDHERLTQVVDRIPLATVAFDSESRVVTWNATAEALFGWKAEEVIGSPNPIVPADEREASNELFAQIRSGVALHGIEATRRARDGPVL